MTGLIVRTDLAPDVDSICDLFDPKYKGKVTMLTEMRDTVPMTLKCMGIDPEKATKRVARRGRQDQGGRRVGQIRRFTGNDYYQDLINGNVDFVLGWSGDAVQLQADNPNIEFVMPKEGCMLWSTSMEIPVGAPNPAAAEAWINYVYDPKVQADIAEYVNYVTPVKGVKEILGKRDPGAGRKPAHLPEPEYTKNCSFESELGRRAGAEVTKAFNEVLDRLSAMRTLSVAALQTAPVARDPAATLALFGERLAGVRATVPGCPARARCPSFTSPASPACSRSSPAIPTRWRCRSPGRSPRALASSPASTASGSSRARSSSAARRRDPQHRAGLLAAGELVARYRKVFPWQPHEDCAPGDRFVTFDIPDIGRFGLAICYDGNFPEAFRQLAWMGAEVVLQPTLTTTSDRAAELVLARANAIVNQLYVVNLNAADPAGLGRSMSSTRRASSASRPARGRSSSPTSSISTPSPVSASHGLAGVSRMWDQLMRAGPADRAAGLRRPHPAAA